MASGCVTGGPLCGNDTTFLSPVKPARPLAGFINDAERPAPLFSCYEAHELADIAIENSHIVDIEKFVPKSSIDDRYRDSSYYLAPEDKVGQEVFAVIRDAMAKRRWLASPASSWPAATAERLSRCG
jgi:hypothetical protein